MSDWSFALSKVKLSHRTLIWPTATQFRGKFVGKGVALVTDRICASRAVLHPLTRARMVVPWRHCQ